MQFSKTKTKINSKSKNIKDLKYNEIYSNVFQRSSLDFFTKHTKRSYNYET